MTVQLHLTEYAPITLPAAAISTEIGSFIHEKYGRYIDIVFPSPRTQNQWRLTALGWVGHLPLPQQGQITIHTKVPVSNLWDMLMWVYDWQSWRHFPGLVQTDSLPAFYDGLAYRLAEQVIELARRGLYGQYHPQQQRQTTVRGRIQLTPTLKKPADIGLVCRYDQYTRDNLHNQILNLTLAHIGRSGWCTAATQQQINRARRALPHTTTPAEIPWQTLTYTRLNEPYRPLHTLCKFFLDGLLPGQHSGTDTAIPFLINMSRLFEQFVAAWLAAHTPEQYRLKSQERVYLDGNSGRQIAIDLVLYNQVGQSIAVLDTKYKAPDRPDMADIYQITFYAHQQNSTAAYLIYPTALQVPLNGRNRDVRYQNLTFSLHGDLNQNGKELLLNIIRHTPQGSRVGFGM